MTTQENPLSLLLLLMASLSVTKMCHQNISLKTTKFPDLKLVLTLNWIFFFFNIKMNKYLWQYLLSNADREQPQHLRVPGRGGDLLRQVLQRSRDKQDGLQPGQPPQARHGGGEAGAAWDQGLVSRARVGGEVTDWLYCSTTGYICSEVVRLDSTVMELRLGRMSLTKEYACDKEYFNESTETFTLVGRT